MARHRPGTTPPRGVRFLYCKEVITLSRPGNQGAALDRAEKIFRQAQTRRDELGRRQFTKGNARELAQADRILAKARQQLQQAQRNYGR